MSAPPSIGQKCKFAGGLWVFRVVDDGFPLQQLPGEHVVFVDPALLLRHDGELVQLQISCVKSPFLAKRAE